MRSPSCKRISLVVLSIAIGANAASASGAPPTDFTGDWKINVEKSDFGMLFAPKAAAVKITQEGTTIKLAESETNAQDETNRVESTLTTDGTQCSGTLIATHYPVTGVMAWSKESLTFDGAGSSGGYDFKVHEEWVLSADKATITITRHFSSARGNTDQTLVLEKQLVATPGGGTGASLRTIRVGGSRACELALGGFGDHRVVSHVATSSERGYAEGERIFSAYSEAISIG